MSSSEPRLGDGPPEVCAAPGVRPSEGRVPVGPSAPMSGSGENTSSGALPTMGNFPTLATPNFPSTAVSIATSKHKRASDGPDSLPLLVSFSDLLLQAPAWLFSAALHMMAVIILGLLFIVPEHSLELLLSLDANDGFEELTGSEFDLALDLAEEAIDTDFEPQELVFLEDPALVEPTEIQPLDTESIQIASPIRMALSGRSEGMQQKLLDAYGGTAATQRAVKEALRWLYRNQGKQGIWSLTGKYTNGASTENEEAATGLALLAFQGAGFTPDGDSQHDYTRATARAWSTMLQRQQEDGNFFRTGRGNGQLYTQAICTIALCELYGMTQNSQYREPAQRAVNYCVRVQSSEGGWRYLPGAGSDLSVTGWFVMAMQSARMAGLEVPTPMLQRVSGYLDSVSHESGSFYGYRPQSAATASMTAEGLLCRQYLGWSQTDSRLRIGAKYLTKNLPDWDDRDAYYWYYATQVCHHMEGKFWRTWNNKMKVLLPANQVEKGRERGSWDPRGDEWGDEGGRLFVTCLSTFMLEVYYRHLPIYQTDLLSGGL